MMLFKSQTFIILFIQLIAITTPQAQNPEEELNGKSQLTVNKAPTPITSASYVSLDGLNLVVIFDKPVNLSSSIESVERRFATFESNAEQSQQQVSALARFPRENSHDQSLAALAGQEIDHTRRSSLDLNACPDPRANLPQPETNLLVQGIQICAKLLTKKTLKLLHKYHLYNCIWPTQVQFIIQLSKPASAATPIRVTFQKNSIATAKGHVDDQREQSSNERELSIDLNRLPLETLGVPLSPRLALTGPNQVPPCGQFSLSAHLSSPYGTQPGESVSLNWQVDRVGFMTTPASSSSASNGTTPVANSSTDSESLELKWRALQHLVSTNKANNLILDAHLLQQTPQAYLFRVIATYSTSFTQITLNATHQVSKIDFEAPVGTIYGSHMLARQPLVNTNQELIILADVQVPECAGNIKQVGAYWQVSDPRVKFEQTYAPFYLVKQNALPERSQVEFRLNLFYGIRVKKFAYVGTVINTGDLAVEAQISDGILAMSVGLDPDKRLELFATTKPSESNRYSYQWSCFDGKTAQQCQRNTLASNATRYELGSLLAANSRPPSAATAPSDSGEPTDTSRLPTSTTAVPLIESQQQRESVLKIPLTWLEPEAQLWFGLQKFDRLSSSGGESQQQQNNFGSPAAASSSSKAEYALVTLQTGPGPTLSIGPVLVGSARHRASVRNPLTGAMVIVAGTPVVIIGRLGPSSEVGSFAWHMPNTLHPLHWTVRNSTNPLTSEPELLSELHLNPNLLVAYAHYQVQLLACSRSTGVRSSAMLSFDAVPSVSQCRVVVNRSALTGNSLIVSVEFCNIPLGLSPATYQIYAIDTSAYDGIIDESRTNAGAQPSQAAAAVEDEYANEADEMFLADQAEPLSMPSLSPVFTLNGLSGALGLLASQERAGTRARIRFGARVCDRLQSCRSFYSRAIGPEHLMPPAMIASMANNTTNRAVKTAELERSQSQALQSMIEGARRANVAGNSIAAISVLNGVISLSQRMLLPTGGVRGDPKSERLVVGSGGLTTSGQHDEKLRELMQTAMRDSLRYGAQSLQRQFHYTDQGQTNLVTQALARILSLGSSSLEFKFRAMRLLTQITRHSIEQSLNLKLNCLSDLRRLQLAYESIFGTFSQYTLDPPQVSMSSPINSNEEQRHKRVESNQQQQQERGKKTIDEENISRSSNNLLRSSSSSTSTLVNSISMVISNSSAPPLALQQTLTGTSKHNHHQANNGRRKREEAIQAYLRYVRQACRAIVAAAAAQLPLGSTHQLAYASDGIGNGNGAGAINSMRAGESRRSNNVLAADNRLQASATNGGATISAAQAASGSAAIVSSLAHQTQLMSEPIELDLNDFGSVTVALVDQRKLGQKLRLQLERQQLRCRNDTRTRCSSFVLALTTFSGKSPFRSLDERPQLPVIELSLLSPVDGSNLIDLLGDGDELHATDFKVSVTFAFRNPPDSSANNSKPFKCYRYSEQASEWQVSELAEAEQVGGANSNSTIEPASDPAASDQVNRLQRIRCTFPGLGVFAAFRNPPPAGEGPVHLTIALGLIGVFALVAVFSLLGCFASSSKARNRSAVSSSAPTSRTDDSSAASSVDSQGYHPQQRVRHPEQTYRNELNNYPLA